MNNVKMLEFQLTQHEHSTDHTNGNAAVTKYTLKAGNISTHNAMAWSTTTI